MLELCIHHRFTFILLCLLSWFFCTTSCISPALLAMRIITLTRQKWLSCSLLTLISLSQFSLRNAICGWHEELEQQRTALSHTLFDWYWNWVAEQWCLRWSDWNSFSYLFSYTSHRSLFSTRDGSTAISSTVPNAFQESIIRGIRVTCESNRFV